MTETAAMADIVLPATTFLEHDDIYTAGGHTFLQIGRAVVPPHAECRSNHEVICGLAERLGAEHPGFAMTAFEIIEQTLRASGLPGTGGVRAKGSGSIAGRASRPRISSTASAIADKKFHFRADWRALGAEPRAAAGISRPCRDHRRRRPGAAVPPGPGAVALVPQHQLQQHAVRHRPRRAADRAGPSRCARRARHRRRRPHPHRQRTRAASSSTPAPSTGCSGAS